MKLKRKGRDRNPLVEITHLISLPDHPPQRKQCSRRLSVLSADDHWTPPTGPTPGGEMFGIGVLVLMLERPRHQAQSQEVLSAL